MSTRVLIGTWPINIGIAMQGRVKVEAERALNAAHGYPDGVPLDAEVPEALERAHYALHMGRGFVVHVAVYSDGTVELDGAGEPKKKREVCRARDGECLWSECPQKTDEQPICVLVRRGGRK